MGQSSIPTVESGWQHDLSSPPHPTFDIDEIRAQELCIHAFMEADGIPQGATGKDVLDLYRASRERLRNGEPLPEGFELQAAYDESVEKWKDFSRSVGRPALRNSQ